MIVIESCNVDMTNDISVAGYYFTYLSLSGYPGLHVGSLTNTSIKFIKIVQQGYTPPVDNRSKIILIVSYISCDCFNLNLFTHLEKAFTLAQKYELWGPKLMLQYSEHSTYGPVGICSLLQREYGD